MTSREEGQIERATHQSHAGEQGAAERVTECGVRSAPERHEKLKHRGGLFPLLAVVCAHLS